MIYVSLNAKKRLNGLILRLKLQLTNVEMGGMTVFPRLGVKIRPIRNAGVFWLNLHHDGTGDTLTIHGSCPVLKGSKWGKKRGLFNGGFE